MCEGRPKQSHMSIIESQNHRIKIPPPQKKKNYLGKQVGEITSYSVLTDWKTKQNKTFFSQL